MVKRITNIRYSDSKKSTNDKKVELDAKRNRMLMETDWTQLPDVHLTSVSRLQWKAWRSEVRGLSTSTHSLDEYKEDLRRLEDTRYDLPIEYDHDTKNIEVYRRKLYATLADLYHKYTRLTFMPNLDMKHQEAISYFKDHDPIPEHYMFLGSVAEHHNVTLDQAAEVIFEEYASYMDTILQEEPMMLYFRTLISAADDPEVLMRTESQILRYYGY